MKKVISMGLVLLSLLCVLASCSSFKCDLCGEEKKGKEYTEEILGKEISYCKNCRSKIDELKEEFKDLGEDMTDLGEDLADGLADFGDSLADLFS